MANNTLYPGYFVLYYNVSGLEHKAVLPCSGNLAGTAMPAVDTVMKNNGTAVTANTAMLAYVTVIKTLFHTTVSFDRYELYGVPSPTSDSVFIATDDIGVAGTSTNPPVIAGQVVGIARTTKGGIAKPTFLEGETGANARYLSPLYGGVTKYTAIANFMKGDDGWIIGRDGGRVAQVTKFVSKTNDALRKKRNLV